MSVELYDFNLETGIKTDVTGTESVGAIDFHTPTFEGYAELMDPKTFEGEASAIALVAGAVIVVALVAGGAYLIFSVQRTVEMAAGGISMGMEVSSAMAEGASSLAAGAGDFLRDIIPS